MQTATLYTLQSKVIPVYDHESVRYLGHVDDVSPLYIEGGHTVFTDKASFKETYLPLHHVCKSFSVPRGCPGITPPKPWKFFDSREDLGSGEREDTYHHLFAVDPELEKILRHVFNGEKVSGKISKLEQEKVVELQGNLDSAYDEIFQLRRRVHKFCEHNLFRRLWIAFCNDLVP